MRTLVLLLAAVVMGYQFAPGAVAGEAEADTWKQHYLRAEIAYARQNIFEARREFLIALKEAQECKEHNELATRIEHLASRYIAEDKREKAQPLLKLLRKLKAKFAQTG